MLFRSSFYSECLESLTKMYTLKVTLCVVLAAISVVNAGENIPPEVMAVIEECANKFGISMDSIKAKEEIPDDKKCFFKCFAVKTGIMSEDGKPDYDKFKAKLIEHGAPAEKVAKVDKCRSIGQLPDPCDTAMAVCKCMKS